jgi:pimeloyl-ACP methyl ester carboxylesterase
VAEVPLHFVVLVNPHEFEVLGLRMPAIASGPDGSEEAIVFLHGHPGSSRDWEQLVAEVGTRNGAWKAKAMPLALHRY